MLWTKFPDELDRSAIGLVLDAYRGRPVDRKAATLAAFNLAGFAASNVIGDGSGAELDQAQQVFGASPAATNEDIDNAFASAQLFAEPTAPGEPPVYGAIPIPWMLLLSIALKVLQRRLAD
jgi:hypothetical protein